jgi:hypothetical protein
MLFQIPDSLSKNNDRFGVVIGRKRDMSNPSNFPQPSATDNSNKLPLPVSHARVPISREH